MSEKLEKLRADLAKAKDRRIQLNNLIELLDRRIAEAEKVEVCEMVRCANLTPELLAALLRQSSNSTPSPAALAAVGATFQMEDADEVLEIWRTVGIICAVHRHGVPRLCLWGREYPPARGNRTPGEGLGGRNRPSDPRG